MISEPDDYGLTVEQTLAHEAAADLPPEFDPYWERWREEVAGLPARWRGAIDAAVNQVVIPSLDWVRVVAQVIMPGAAPRGVVITTHGYGSVPDSFEEAPDQTKAWLERGLIVLRLRVRGFPPSTLDIGDLRGQWILHRIESTQGWIMRGAVADLVQAYRCARVRFGAAMPIALHGESFGGGLAVITAAQLTALGDLPARLILALPSLGDWRWRASRYCSGAGAQVSMMLEALRGQERDDLAQRLLLFDAALHARRVDVPCLCKLAQRDDAVPAPTAAAVFNALAGSTKWRFVTRYGHFEGGIADTRQHALFERLHPDFADPAQSPAEVLRNQPAVLL